MVDTSWYILVTGTGTPKDVVEKVRQAFAESLRLPAIERMFADAGLIGHPGMTPQEITERLRAERRIWEPVIRKAGIKLH
jgi:tripartite-type tricarboxylate transporter receptor subunit TctC